jgi:hypothetical protein
MQPSIPDHERSMLQMGSIAFIAGLIIIIVSTLFHASGEGLMDNPVVFAVYTVFELLLGGCCSYIVKEVDPIDISKIIPMSDDNQSFLWSDIDELPKVSSCGKMTVVVNTIL